MGRSPESIEKRRIADREKKRRLSLDPEYREKKSAQRKANRLQNPERDKATARAYYRRNKESENRKRADRARRNREHQREYNRKLYASNKEHFRSIIYAARNRRDPTRGIATELRRLKNGDITLDQFVESIGRRTASLDERLEKLTAGHSGEALRPRPSEQRSCLRTSDNAINEGEARPNEVRKGASERE